LEQLSFKLESDFEDVISEFEFLWFPDPDVDIGILDYYVTEFKKTLMIKLYCLVKSFEMRKQGTLIGETRSSNWFLTKLGHFRNEIKFYL
jgi:hypothetical protein